MRAYADTSFLVKLVSDESGSISAMAEFRRLDFPPLFFLPLHALEVANAIRHRAFHLRRSTESGQRAAIARERDAALARVRNAGSNAAGSLMPPQIATKPCSVPGRFLNAILNASAAAALTCCTSRWRSNLNPRPS